MHKRLMTTLLTFQNCSCPTSIIYCKDHTLIDQVMGLDMAQVHKDIAEQQAAPQA